MAQPARSQVRPKSTATATSKERTPRAAKGASTVRPFNMPFESKNITFILIGIAIVTLGYVVMGMSETMGFMALNVSPIMLLLGYLVVIPMGIMYGAKRKKSEPMTEESSAS
ncbi:MAG: hypothetical protein WCH46_10710 [bacterium]